MIKSTKQAFSDAVLLLFPSIDGKLVLHYDASEIATGAIFSILERFDIKLIKFSF